MSQIGIVAAAALAGAIVSAAAAQDAVQWRVEDGGNGHWYAVRESSLGWHAASSVATSEGGHLATIASAEENALIVSLRDQTPHGGVWIGLRQASGSREPSSGWEWVTGEPVVYTNWRGANNEPDDAGSSNGSDDCDYAEICCSSDEWGDWAGGSPIATYAIEWSADCNSDGLIDYGQILNGELPDLDDDGIPDCCANGLSCDCNSDGLIDYGQILNGTIRDQDSNGIPDCCETGAPCYVGNTYQVGPGSPGTIQALIDFVLMDGDTILLEPGVFLLEAPIDTNGVQFAMLGTTDPETGRPLTSLDGQGLHRILLAEAGGCYFEALTIQHSGQTALSGDFCELRNCIFLDNFSPDDPAAAYGRGLAFHDCEFAGNQGGWTGAVYTKSGSEGAAVIGCVFTDNTASTSSVGGALYARASVPIRDCVFQGNSSAGDSGAVEARASCLIEDCIFLSNSCSDYGGAVVAEGGVIRGCYFSENTSGRNGGGGYFIECLVEDTEFVGNYALKGGGMAGSVIQGVGLVIRSNSASCDGGGVLDVGFGGLSLSACSISENESGCGGGGIYSSGASLVLDACSLSQNSAGHGGSVYCAVAEGSGEVLITDTAITANNATLAGGGLFVERGRAAQLIGSTVCENSPDQIAGQWSGDPLSEVCGDGPCVGDVNLDGQVDSTDLGLVLALWGTSSTLVDINGDGLVDAADLGLLIGAWGTCQ